MQDINIKELLHKDNARIRWVEYGVANTFSYNWKNQEYKIIEINKALIDYPKLFYPVLFHELKHTKKILSTDDMINDFSWENLKSLPNLGIISFMLTHPKSLTQILPIQYAERHGIVWDINLIIVWIIALGLGFFIKYKII